MLPVLAEVEDAPLDGGYSSVRAGAEDIGLEEVQLGITIRETIKRNKSLNVKKKNPEPEMVPVSQLRSSSCSQKGLRQVDKALILLLLLLFDLLLRLLNDPLVLGVDLPLPRLDPLPGVGDQKGEPVQPGQEVEGSGHRKLLGTWESNKFVLLVEANKLARTPPSSLRAWIFFQKGSPLWYPRPKTMSLSMLPTVCESSGSNKLDVGCRSWRSSARVRIKREKPFGGITSVTVPAANSLTLSRILASIWALAAALPWLVPAMPLSRKYPLANRRWLCHSSPSAQTSPRPCIMP